MLLVLPPAPRSAMTSFMTTFPPYMDRNSITDPGKPSGCCCCCWPGSAAVLLPLGPLPLLLLLLLVELLPAASCTAFSSTCSSSQASCPAGSTLCLNAVNCSSCVSRVKQQKADTPPKKLRRSLHKQQYQDVPGCCCSSAVSSHCRALAQHPPHLQQAQQLPRVTCLLLR
jgi:hypothetical protein